MGADTLAANERTQVDSGGASTRGQSISGTRDGAEGIDAGVIEKVEEGPVVTFDVDAAVAIEPYAAPDAARQLAEAGTSMAPLACTEGRPPAGPEVSDMIFDAGAPLDTPSGGEILSGTYNLIAQEIYGETCSNPITYQLTWVVIATSPTRGTIEASAHRQSDGYEGAGVLEYVTSGTTLSVRSICSGDTRFQGGQYTATADSIVQFSEDRGCGAFVARFMRE